MLNKSLRSTSQFEHAVSRNANGPLLQGSHIKREHQKGEAMGILRTLIIAGGALALLPSPPPGPSGEAAPAGPGNFAYLAAAAETVADVKGFCQRNPTACSTASAAATVVEGKAKYSAKLVYEWANDRPEKPEPTQTAAIQPPLPILKKPRVTPKG
jgi:Family of unknown function (DUF5330)